MIESDWQVHSETYAVPRTHGVMFGPLLALSLIAMFPIFDYAASWLYPGRPHWLYDLIAATLSAMLALAIGYRGYRRFFAYQQLLEQHVTQRRIAENELETLFSLSLDMLTITGQEPQFSRVNPAFSETLGYDADELLARPYTDFVHPDDRPATLAAITRLNAGEPIIDFVNRYRRADGSYRWLQWRASHSKVLGLTCAVARDITEARMREQALAESEQRFRLLFENMSDGVAVYEATDDGRDFVFRDFNKAGERISRISKDELIGHRLTEIFPGVETFGLLDVMRAVWHDGEPRSHPARRYRDQRLELWVENFVFRLPSGELVAVYRDITERKAAEDLLRQSEARFRAVFEQAPIGIDLVSPDGLVIRANEALQQMLGYREDEMLGRSFRDWTHPDDLEGSQALAQRLREGGDDRLAIEKRYVRKDGGTIWANTQVAAVRDSAGVLDYFVAMVEDTSERHRAQQETRALLEQNRFLARRLLQVQEQERAWIARELHDEIGQSLTGIRADAQAILSRSRAPELVPIRESAQAIDEVANRLYSAAYALMHQLRPSLLDDLGLHAGLDQLLDHWRRQHPRTRCVFEFDDACEALPDDTELVLYRTVQEALTNISKHAAAASIRIDLRCLDPETTAPARIQLCVSDDGRGFDPDAPPRGMGLIGMRERVMSVGGEFDLHTARGKGTTICVSIPIAVD